MSATIAIKASVLAGMLTASLLLTGCASPSGSHDSATTAAPDTASAAATPASNANGVVSACTIVTEADATTALGVDPGPGTETTQSGASSCTFGTSPTMVTVDLLPTGGKADYDHARETAPAGDLVDVAGVGDGAFGVFKNVAAEIWFYKGDTMVSIGVINTGAATPPQDDTITLAQTVAGRL